MRTLLVIEIDHTKDNHPAWPEGDWTAIDIREYIEHEGVIGITRVTSIKLDG